MKQHTYHTTYTFSVLRRIRNHRFEFTCNREESTIFGPLVEVLVNQPKGYISEHGFDVILRKFYGSFNVFEHIYSSDVFYKLGSDLLVGHSSTKDSVFAVPWDNVYENFELQSSVIYFADSHCFESYLSKEDHAFEGRPQLIDFPERCCFVCGYDEDDTKCISHHDGGDSYEDEKVVPDEDEADESEEDERLLIPCARCHLVACSHCWSKSEGLGHNVNGKCKKLTYYSRIDGEESYYQ